MIEKGLGFLVVVCYLAPPPPPTPLSRRYSPPLARRKTEKVRQLADGREGVGGEEPNNTKARKPGLL
jgi:hypothetical protein